MLNSLKVISVAVLVLVAQFASADAHQVYLAADEAYSYARRACNADGLEDVQYYAKRTMNAVESVLFIAVSDSGYVRTLAQYVYDLARKAYRSGDFDDAIYYMRKAKSSASDLMSAALIMQD